ncbi:Uncharacterised protein [Mycobacteroides abscessus subsp. abscessus]|nr:Uncharacterised protein [Mycobacteroides abscessus subsp. abscessus]
MGPSGVARAPSRSSTPHAGLVAGGSNPMPVIKMVSDKKACSWRRFVVPPSAKYRCTCNATPPGTVEHSISSASGACSPETTTAGTPDAITASMPSSQPRRPPSSRTTTAPIPSSRPGRSSTWMREGLAHR